MFLRHLFILCAFTIALVLHSAIANAQQATSPDYSVNEYHFGTGGEVDLNSAQYKARASTGNLGVGSSSSTNFRAESGSITPDTEYIEFFVNASTINLGQQSTSTTSQGTATFYVKTYLASGYVVRNASAPPSIPLHTLSAPSSAVASAVGTEQFGINLAANTCALCLPSTSFGSAPVQIPSSTFSFGAAATGYNTANVYKYVNGDVIAQSTQSSGQTDYTVSYILNISTVTPAGTYTMNHVMVATSTY